MPRSRFVVDRDGKRVSLGLCPQTAAWWRDVSSMPHCVLWAASDWRFAIETAFVADMLFQGDRAAASELRLRERVMGTTIDARRDLRIRYVAPEKPQEEKRRPGRSSSTITNIEDRRERLLDGDAG